MHPTSSIFLDSHFQRPLNPTKQFPPWTNPTWPLRWRSSQSSSLPRSAMQGSNAASPCQPAKVQQRSRLKVGYLSFHASLVSHKQLLTQDAWTRHSFASSFFCWKLPNIIPNGGETTDHMEILPERQGRPNCHGNPTPLGMLLCRIILAGVSIRSMFGIPGNFKKATLVCLAIRVDIGTVGPAAALTFCKPNH